MNKTNSKRHKLNVNDRWPCGPYLQFLALDFNVQPWTARNTHFSFPPLVLWFTSKVEDTRFLAGTRAQSALHILFHASTAWRTIPRHRRPLNINYSHYLQTYLQHIYNYERAKRHEKKELAQYGALLGSKLIMQTFFYDDFRIATLVAWLIANVVSFDIFCENLLLSARFMAYKCFSLPLLSNCNSCYMVNCQLSFSSHFLRKLTSFCTVYGLRHKHSQAIFRT